MKDAVRHLADTEQGDVARLKDSNDMRLRVGDWRVFFSYDNGPRIIHVLGVQPRGAAYKKR